MENNNDINIAEILRDCPKDTKLYSPLFGEVELKTIHDLHFPIVTEIVNEEYKLMSKKVDFTKDGTSFEIPNTECMIFPSQKMRDWTKFFKRGDVVYSKTGKIIAIFEGWANDDYTEFNTTINFYVYDASYGEEEICHTNCFVKASDEERATFIANAEKHYNGKFNPETLQVEPVKLECPFKPFDKVLVRANKDYVWYASYFSHYRGNEDCPYACIDGSYHYCIPYNEHTAHLLGTTDPYTEGGDK